MVQPYRHHGHHHGHHGAVSMPCLGHCCRSYGVSSALVVPEMKQFASPVVDEPLGPPAFITKLHKRMIHVVNISRAQVLLCCSNQLNPGAPMVCVNQLLTPTEQNPFHLNYTILLRLPRNPGLLLFRSTALAYGEFVVLWVVFYTGNFVLANAIIYTVLTVMTVWCHLKTMLTEPGVVPRMALPLREESEDGATAASHTLCGRCESYKPTR